MYSPYDENKEPLLTRYECLDVFFFAFTVGFLISNIREYLR